MIPSGYKEDKVFTQLPEDGSGDLTFTRASDGTRVNSEGYIERVPWNLLQQSNTFSTTWVNNGTTETGGQTGYDGTNEAWLLNKSIAGGSIRQSIVFNGVGTYSVYAKAGTLNYILLYVNYGTGRDTQAYFDLSSGSVGTTIAEIDANIESVGNGWYRCSVTFNTPTATASVLFFPANDDGDTSGTSGSIYIQDAQLNEGPTAKPYIATTNRQDVPRLDYSNGCPCLLLEPQRTNLVKYSDQFDNAAWAKSNLSVTANNTISPDGTQNAERLTENASTAQHFVGQSVSLVSSLAYTFYVYAKKGERDILQLSPSVAYLTSGGYANFNLTNGTVTASGGGATGSIVEFSDGWYKCQLNFTANASASGTFALFMQESGTASRGVSYTGDGTSGLYIWGAQFEAGSYPTSYIPTTSAAVTRLADAAYKTGISSLIGQTEGTLFLDFIYKVGDQTRVSLSDGSSVNWIFVGIPDSSTHCRIYIRTNATVQVDTSSNLLGIFVSGQRYKIAVAYKSGDWAICVNGVIKTSGTQTFTPSASFNTIALTGNSPAPSNQIGLNQLFNASLYKTRLTNAQLAELTTL